MTPELQKKVDAAIKLLQVAAGDDVVEVAYSGGKDSDVILELARMSGIKFRAIYKNTTIDPPGTIKHAKDNGVEILNPKKNFITILAENGFPTRTSRFCCRYLKEYKVLDKVVMGVRKAESTKRAKRYSEPTECRFYGNKKDHVEAIYPILDWSDQDVVDFIVARGIKVHSLYYREDGTIDPKRRLGCMCCPLASIGKRREQFKKYPNMIKVYIRAGQKYRETHPNVNRVKDHKDIYMWFAREVFYDSQILWEQSHKDLLFEVETDYKKFIEDYFNIQLPDYSQSTPNPDTVSDHQPDSVSDHQPDSVSASRPNSDIR